MKKLFFFCFVVLAFCFYHQPSHSAVRCQNFFIKSNFKSHLQANLFIGMLVRNSNDRDSLIVGPYLGRGHEALFLEASKKDRNPINKILWSGELQVQWSQGTMEIVKANETSGFAHQLMEGGLPSYLNETNLETQNSVEALRNFVASDLTFASKPQLNRYTPSAEHIYAPLNNIDGNSRHRTGNHLQIISAYLRHNQRGIEWGAPELNRLVESFNSLRVIGTAYLEIFDKALINEKQELLVEFVELMDSLIQGWRADREFTDYNIQQLATLIEPAQSILLDQQTPALLFQFYESAGMQPVVAAEEAPPLLNTPLISH